VIGVIAGDVIGSVHEHGLTKSTDSSAPLLPAEIRQQEEAPRICGFPQTYRRRWASGYSARGLSS